MSHHHRDQSEDQGLVFSHNDHHSFSCTYYVQSPSTISHANSADIRHVTANIRHVTTNEDGSVFQSPARTETLINNDGAYSSRGSNVVGDNYFRHAKKISYDARSHDTEDLVAEKNRLIMVNASHGHNHDVHDVDGEVYDYYYGKKSRESSGFWKTYCSYSNSDSSSWICLQISWRFLVSLIVALIVFYVSARPPSPKISLQIRRIGEFGLGEGVDGSGVATKMLTCNCSLNLIIHNKSKLFGLHIQPPTLQLSFHGVSFASSHGQEMYAESGTTTFGLWVGTRNKAMYGAGRDMEDMLDSGHGLPLTIRLSFSSKARVVLNLITTNFHHKAHCLLVLRRGYDKKHQTHLYNTTCDFALK